MVNYGLRPMGLADVDAVARLEAAASPDPWSRQLFVDELAGDRSDRLWLVAEPESEKEGSEPFGFAGLLFVVDECHVMNMVVAPQWRRRGVASRLLAALLVQAADRGAISATLEVRASNEPAASLYRRFGFVDSGTRPGYYPNGEDAVVMWCRRIDKPATYERFQSELRGHQP